MSISTSTADASAGTAADLARPAFLSGEILHTVYDGITDDLLTAGLRHDGIGSDTPPGFADPRNPTPAELRRRLIYESWRALIDRTPGGGYGLLYGPAVAGDARAAAMGGRIAGDEYLAYAARTVDGLCQVVTLLLQVPRSFDPANACLIAAPSSGSRGVYGAIGTVGEWGLKRGCAVVYTDKGTGIGAHDLGRDTVYGRRGERMPAAAAGQGAHFKADLPPEGLAEFNRRAPHRFAFKHAHSKVNPEAFWGEDVLRAIAFAFYVLNTRYQGQTVLTPRNTLVIAASVSNGGAACLRAAEQDQEGLIHGVVAAEPAVQPRPDRSFVIVQGDGPPLVEHSRPLLDYITLVNLYQACALLDPQLTRAAPPVVPQNPGLTSASPERCRVLHERGLLKETTLAGQGAEAQRIINDYGILSEQNPLEPFHHFAYVPQAIAVTYANAYGGFGVEDRLCGYSFAGIDRSGQPAPLSEEVSATLFAIGNGIPPTPPTPLGVALINDEAPGGATEDRASTPNQNLDGALRLRRLATGRHEEAGTSLTPEEQRQHEAILKGIAAVRATGTLQGKPAIIVHGRSDALLPPNHTGRAYYGLNQVIEGETSSLRYYEVTNAHHFEAFNALPGFAERYVPLHHYVQQALALMYNHLKHRMPLPPSQVVRTTPRGISADGTAPPIGTANLPPIAFDPVPMARITFASGELHVPN